MKFSDTQLTKSAEYLLDISKLLAGATFVAVFVPGALKTFNIWLFLGGIIVTGVTFVGGLKLLPPKS